MWGTAGLVATKFISNTLTPMVGGTISGQPLMRIAWGVGMAYLSAWGLSMIAGDRVFTPAFVGGSMAAAQDFVTTYLAGVVPGISGVGVYSPRAIQLPAPRGMGVYSPPARVRHEVIS